MRYDPKLAKEEIRENHKLFKERISVFKRKGLNFETSRQFVLNKTGFLGGPILEIGTGTGHTALTLAKAGYRFSSVDKDEEALRRAALNLAHEGLLSKVELYVMDAASLEFPAQAMNSVIAVNFFHHFKNGSCEQVLREIDRVLAPGGKVIVADFNKRGMEIVTAVHAGEGHRHEDSGITRNDVSSFFTNLNYKIQNFEDGFHWLFAGEKKSKE